MSHNLAMLTSLAPHETLAIWRRRTGRTQEAAAKVLGISRDYYGDLERGAYKPGRDLSVTIAREAGIPVEAWSSSKPEAVA